MKITFCRSTETITCDRFIVEIIKLT